MIDREMKLPDEIDQSRSGRCLVGETKVDNVPASHTADKSGPTSPGRARPPTLTHSLVLRQENLHRHNYQNKIIEAPYEHHNI